MTIFNPTNDLDLRHAAINYLLKGYSVVPLIGKRCPMGWALYCQQRATASELRWWEGEGWLQNLGVVAGAVSGNLVFIDLDGEQAVQAFGDHFPQMVADTFSVRTGSGGLHIWLKADTLPANRKVSLGDGHNGVEIRANRQYVVVPPSVHPDTGKRYEIAVRKPVLRVYSLSAVNAWLDTLESPQPRAFAPKDQPEKPTINFDSPRLYDRKGQPVRNPKAYARFALADEARRVASTPHGQQNINLNLAAFRMAQLVKRDLLTESEVEQALLNAARGRADRDQSDREILKTIQSGLQNGKAKTDGR